MRGTLLGLASALIHFYLVENRPLYLMIPALDAVALAIAKREYFKNEGHDHHRQAVDRVGSSCPLGESITEFDKLMKKALNSLDSEFRWEGQCVKVEFEGKNYGTFAYIITRHMLYVVFAISIFQFARAASRSKTGFSFWNGDYFAFTIKREENQIFRYALCIFVAVCVLIVYLTALFVFQHATEEKENPFKMVYLFFSENLSVMLSFLVGFYLIVIPVDTSGMEEIDLRAFSQVTFKRPWYACLYQSNDFFYQRLLVAGVALGKGNTTRLAAICDNPQSARWLQEAFKGDPAKAQITDRLVE